jgi:anaerobic nitric oxide reductase transcription regulator
MTMMQAGVLDHTRVIMTSNSLLDALLPIIDDLARDLPDRERCRRLLAALRMLVPCDAVALLRLENEHFVPLAVEGLHDDVMGRRFRFDEHPRLAAVMRSAGVLRFPADCSMPDPYDGLINAPAQALTVHDCMGCPIRIDDQPWGLVTLDAADSSRFRARDVQVLDAFARLIVATIKASERFNALNRRIEDEHMLAERYLQLATRSDAPALTGQSAAYKRLLAEIRLVARSDLTVLISGETGVGKELVAQAIHARSDRAQQPLVSVNCAALPETLAESELFGHVRGAFSGAVGARRGKFELADGGTLFLDEVGELPQTIQAKLLRVLQSGQLQRVGSDLEHRVDVRVIAATNRDLAEEIRKGRFRADLYHRLSVYPLRVPPLRDRGRDVLVLAGSFLEQNRSRLRLRSLRLTAESQAALLAHRWPGNVRELEHLIGRAALKAQVGTNSAQVVSIEPRHLDLPPAQSVAAGEPAPDVGPGATMSLREAVDRYQARMIEAALDRNARSWAAAATALGIDRSNLRRLAARLGISDSGKA